MELTIKISDQLADRVTAWAELMQQDVPDVVESALDVVLPQLSEAYLPVASLSDDALVELARVKMDANLGDRLTDLQRQQRDDSLNASEKQELSELMQLYNILWVRQSQALAIAVERGLLPPLND